jgi:hypothetical protein
LIELWLSTDSTWGKNLRSVYTYDDENGYRKTTLDQIWNAYLWDWENEWRYYYTYDNNWNLILTDMDRCDRWENDWVDYYNFSYDYDTEGRIILDLTEFWWNSGGVWEFRELYNYYYDNNGNLTNMILQYYNYSLNEWIDSEQNKYMYDTQDKLLVDQYEIWNNNYWLSRWQKSYNYDDLNNLTNFIYTFESDSVLPYSEVSLYNNGVLYKYECSELTAYYSPLTDIKDSENLLNNYSLSQNYPNPFNPNTKIKFNVAEALNASTTNVLLKVYDILGNEITTLLNEQKPPGTYEIEFNAQNLASGVYFYQINIGSFNQVRKMLLLK